MGIQIEFNPDLALRAYGTLERAIEECLPQTLKPGRAYSFLKEGQRNYWLEREIPLLETKGNQNLSRPLASITIKEYTHFMLNEKPHTRGIYLVNKVYNPEDKTIHFEGMNKVE